jgi:putative cell wall-binding protein
VYVVGADRMPDALAVTPAAYRDGAPVLPVHAFALPAPVADELTRLQPAEIVVLGGPAAVSDAVAAELATYTDGSVTRRSGGTRYGTAFAVAVSTFSGAAVPVAYVVNGNELVNGDGFFAALTGGVAAARAGGPVLLTTPTSLPSETQQALSALDPASIVIVGRTDEVSTAVETQLHSFTTGSVVRVAGSDRYTTSVEVSKSAFPAGAPTVYLANGLDLAQPLVGAAAAAHAGGPLLLVPNSCVTAEVEAEIERLQPTTIVVVGNRRDVTAAVETRRPCGPPTVTRLSPGTGSVSGGTVVVITGQQLVLANGVDFGGTPAGSVHVVSDTRLRVTSPPGSAGVVDVRVTTPWGTSAVTPADQFTYG